MPTPVYNGSALTAPMAAISNAQAQEYDRHGVLVLEPFVGEQLLDSVVSDMHHISRNLLHKGDVYQRVQDAWKFSDSITRIATDETVLTILRKLYGREPLPFQTLNFDVPTQQPVHSDTLHFNSLPRGLMCGVWIALEDVGMGQGPLVYYPGSHKLPEYTFSDFGLASGFGADELRMYQARIEELIEAKELEPDYGVIGKGSALIWASNLLHGGHEWIDRSLTRHSMVTHYFFEDSQYWRPGLSSETPCFFEPEWISF